MRLLILLLLLVLVVGCAQKQTACTEEAKLCPDGSAVGRTGPDCEFAPCPDTERYCTVEERSADRCIDLYQPVCGWSDPEKIQCIKYPCAQTYPNSCHACVDENVLYWTPGDCPE